MWIDVKPFIAFILLFLPLLGSLGAAVANDVATADAPNAAQQASGQSSTLLQGLRMQPMSELTTADCHARDFNDRDWPKIAFTRIQPQQHLCLRADLWITPDNLPSNPALLLVALAAYEIRLNGEPLGKSGVVGQSATSETVGGITGLFSLPSQVLKPGKHLLSIELSSFHADPSFAAISYWLRITDQQALADSLLQVSLTTAFLMGCMAILCLLFLLLYLSLSRDNAILLFSLLCCATAVLLVLEQWKFWVNYPYDWHLPRLQLITAVTLVVTLLLPSFYLQQHQLPHKRYWLLGLILGLSSAVIISNSYDQRSEWLFILALAVVVAINITALKAKKAFAKSATAMNSLSLLGLLVAPTLFLELGFSLSIFLVLISIGLALLRQLKQQRDMALQTSRLKGELLRRNLQPHYLMNCLTLVQELIDVAPEQANHFVAQLAQEFRALVQMSDRDLVSLAEEVALCQSHLHIMSIRYQQDYQLIVSADKPNNSSPDVTQNILIPPAILHSQIENCFTHNRIDQHHQLSLTVSQQGDNLRLVLSTPIAAAINHRGLGLGEAYIRGKLAEVCEPGWQLSSSAQGQYWVTCYEFKVLKPKVDNLSQPPIGEYP